MSRSTAFLLALAMMACGHDTAEGDTTSSSATSDETTGSTSTTTSDETAAVVIPPYCGDHIVNADEECDDDDPSCWYCIRDRKVFVTRWTLNTPFQNGVDTVDAHCQMEAEDEGFSGTFFAWLTDKPENAPAWRFHHHEGRYVMYHAELDKNLIVAYGWDDLTDGTLSTGIHCDASGNCEGLSSYAISTGTNYLGYGTDEDCNDWTSIQNQGNHTYGVAGESSLYWSDKYTGSGGASCNGALRFYCFEQ